MSNSQPHDVFYTAEFVDGPLSGDSQERVLVHGKHDVKLSVVALVDGLESIFRYNELETREIQGKLHVKYTFDAGISDPFESEDENE
ncbi:unannotated protein [freshwater metagenome]|jgi:hypothetical protein|uniref:Unannotated protein n=1 Tax=freshwater metagenome TaxID=449393 RepID=A0A6J6CT34_9ZZZZ|nr:hypothetical protein [Actinomycetota bacterium]MTA81134.1 hypothetical protein [Actinomycetota bacterium]